ncbi:MAG: hypothetical protein JSU87_12090 [Gemmatimonadota bacterium]|nr:MAG: hypothetical protein JSU87_12090 [Gemmatimonadota bacterium]
MKMNTRGRLLIGGLGLGLIAACGPGGGVYVGVAVPGPYGGPYPYPGYVGRPPMVYGGGVYEAEALNEADPPDATTPAAAVARVGGPPTGTASTPPAKSEASGDRESG